MALKLNRFMHSHTALDRPSNTTSEKAHFNCNYKLHIYLFISDNATR